MINFIRNNLTVNSFLSNYQSDFRSSHSTNQRYFNIDNGSVTSIVFLDLAKAFNTIDHDISSKFQTVRR